MAQETKETPNKETPKGLFLAGRIVDKRHEPADGQKKDKFKLLVLVPGFDQLFQVTVSATDYMNREIESEFTRSFRFSIFKDKTYWQPV